MEQELFSLSIENLIRSIPAPPTTLPPLPDDQQDRKKQRESVYLDKGSVPRSSSLPSANLSFDFQQLLSFATSPELEGETRKIACSMILALPAKDVNDQLTKLYNTMISNRTSGEKPEKKDKKDKTNSNVAIRRSGSFKAMGITFKKIQRTTSTDKLFFSVRRSFKKNIKKNRGAI
jgi:hypothetical protein